MDDFTEAYIECALWCTTDQSREDGGDPLDASYGPDDIAPRAMLAIVRDCADFQLTYGHLFVGRESLAGHDFWLTRNGHGAGFWDGDWPEPAASELTKASKAYGSEDPYVDDDGMIHGFGE